MGNRGEDATTSGMKKNVLWTGKTAHMTSLVQECLHCISTCTRGIVLRPYGHASHAKRPNEVFQIGFLFMRASYSKLSYVLVMSDNFSLYIWLYETHSTTNEAATDAVVIWTAGST